MALRIKALSFPFLFWIFIAPIKLYRLQYTDELIIGVDQGGGGGVGQVCYILGGGL